MFTLPDNEKFELDRAETLRLRLSKSTGLEICQNLIMRGVETGRQEDVYGNGDRSCAMYVSLMIWGVGLCANPKASVRSLIAELELHGWEETDEPAPLRIVIWGKKDGDDGFPYRHAGICHDLEFAYCNDPVTKVPQLQGIYDLRLHNGDPRPVECFYKHPLLEQR